MAGARSSSNTGGRLDKQSRQGKEEEQDDGGREGERARRRGRDGKREREVSKVRSSLMSWWEGTELFVPLWYSTPTAFYKPSKHFSEIIIQK